jgi:hypothetical protein
VPLIDALCGVWSTGWTLRGCAPWSRPAVIMIDRWGCKDTSIGLMLTIEVALEPVSYEPERGKARGRARMTAATACFQSAIKASYCTGLRKVQASLADWGFLRRPWHRAIRFVQMG